MDSKILKYPIYIVSKGRYYNPLTAKMFENSDIQYNIVIEPQEYNEYSKVIDKEKIITLPFQNLGLGSYPARKFIMQKSKENGDHKHWIFDDNIRNCVKLNKGQRTNCDPKEAIYYHEKFVDKFLNVALSGFNYRYFVDSQTKKPFFYNTHVYSAILINNRFPGQWRLIYNEDVDLCLQALHKGWCTILFNAYVIEKMTTASKMKGGNQDELYNNNSFEKMYLKAKTLKEVWPDYVKVVKRFNRPHHHINWKKHFKQNFKYA